MLSWEAWWDWWLAVFCFSKILIEVNKQDRGDPKNLHANKSDIKKYAYVCRTLDFPALNSRIRQTGTWSSRKGRGRELDLRACLLPAPAWMPCVHPARSPESKLGQPKLLLLGPQFLSWNRPLWRGLKWRYLSVSYSTQIYWVPSSECWQKHTVGSSGRSGSRPLCVGRTDGLDPRWVNHVPLLWQWVSK